ncbi:hypothetical protein LTR16_003828, partial [Cryomyces antarcticus]
FTTSLLRANMWQAASLTEEVSTPVRTHLPCWTLSTLYARRSYTELLLWQGSYQ